jgi:hypothetical protein
MSVYYIDHPLEELICLLRLEQQTSIGIPVAKIIWTSDWYDNASVLVFGTGKWYRYYAIRFNITNFAKTWEQNMIIANDEKSLYNYHKTRIVIGKPI